MEAIARVRSNHPEMPAGSLARFTLRDAQLTIAREYGFESWHALNTEVGERMVDERDLHRWFGVHLNNGVWDAIDAAEIGAESPLSDRELLLYSAYASAYHWRNVGNEANHARGEHLIARTALLVGFYDEAMRHARRCLEICESNPGLVEDWDLAFAHEAVARAAAALGDRSTAAEHHRVAADLGAAIGEEGDRVLFLEVLARGPWFGIA
ncbi:MAG TPA: hypothetical protein VGB41_00785 [Acidimicrobiia bacterium]